jgi:hypothetical protein
LFRHFQREGDREIERERKREIDVEWMKGERRILSLTVLVSE